MVPGGRFFAAGNAVIVGYVGNRAYNKAWQGAKQSYTAINIAFCFENREIFSVNLEKKVPKVGFW